MRILPRALAAVLALAGPVSAQIYPYYPPPNQSWNASTGLLTLGGTTPALNSPNVPSGNGVIDNDEGVVIGGGTTDIPSLENASAVTGQDSFVFGAGKSLTPCTGVASSLNGNGFASTLIFSPFAMFYTSCADTPTVQLQSLGNANASASGVTLRIINNANVASPGTSPNSLDLGTTNTNSTACPNHVSGVVPNLPYVPALGFTICAFIDSSWMPLVIGGDYAWWFAFKDGTHILGSIGNDPLSSTGGAQWLAVTGSASSDAMVVIGDNTKATSLTNIVGGSPANTRVNNVPIASVVTGSWTAQIATGCTTTPSATFTYSRSGQIVTLTNGAAGALTCTSNATGMTITGLPAALFPAHEHEVAVQDLEDSGTNQLSGAVIVSTAGVLTLLLARTNITTNDVVTANAAFTASGVKGIAHDAFSVTYSLD